MQARKLGNRSLEVSALGLGCMGMSAAYGRGQAGDDSLAPGRGRARHHDQLVITDRKRNP